MSGFSRMRSRYDGLNWFEVRFNLQSCVRPVVNCRKRKTMYTLLYTSRFLFYSYFSFMHFKMQTSQTVSSKSKFTVYIEICVWGKECSQSMTVLIKSENTERINVSIFNIARRISAHLNDAFRRVSLEIS